MWTAIKSDLFEFVSTVQQETSKTIHLLHSSNEEPASTHNRVEEKLKALRESRDTFSQVCSRYSYARVTFVQEISKDDEEPFHIFRAHFSLGSEASAVRHLLDSSPHIASHYHSLVPQHLSAEEFWTRYFYRASKITSSRGGSSNSLSLELLEDEEEEIGWENDETNEEENQPSPPLVDNTTAPPGDVIDNDGSAAPPSPQSATAAISKSPSPPALPSRSVTTTIVSASPTVTTVVPAAPDAEVQQLRDRLAELEKELHEKQLVIDQLQQRLIASATSMSSFATVSHEHDTDSSNASGDKKQKVPMEHRKHLAMNGSDDEEEEGWDDSWG